MTREHYWFWINNIAGVGRKTIGSLLEYYKDIEVVYSISVSEAKRWLKPKVLDAFIYSRNSYQITLLYNQLAAQNIRFLSCEHEEYPYKLKEIYDYPFGIYVKGNLPSQQGKSIAIVGTRNPSSYGREMAHFFGRELAKNQIQIISGLARGIDSDAHSGALDAEGYTCGVLGCGVNVCYPPENINLFMKVKEKGGILSEYPPHTKPKAGLFPMRNRIISGLSDGVLIVEAKEKSGSLITADLGLDQGREIYVLPGRSIDPLSQGCNNLIKMGAKLVTSPNDILSDFKISYNNSINYFENKYKMLEEYEKVVYSCVSLKPKYIDAIIKETNLPVSEVLSILFRLELNNYIKQIVKNYYILSL